MLLAYVELPWYGHVLLVLAGMATGAINTLAGSGSIFALSALIFFGLPADLANGTNRIGTTLQGLTAVSVFRKHDKSLFKTSLPHLIPSFIGALIGAQVAADIGDKLFKMLLGGLMIFLLLITLFSPTKGIKETLPKHPVIQVIALFAIGFYGGFIQVGIGILLLVGLVSLSGLTLAKANTIKSVIVMAYSIPVLFIFVGHGEVEWVMGSWLALGQFAGTYLAARFAINSPRINEVIKWLLVVMMIVTAGKLFFGA